MCSCTLVSALTVRAGYGRQFIPAMRNMIDMPAARRIDCWGQTIPCSRTMQMIQNHTVLTSPAVQSIPNYYNNFPTGWSMSSGVSEAVLCINDSHWICTKKITFSLCHPCFQFDACTVVSRAIHQALHLARSMPRVSRGCFWQSELTLKRNHKELMLCYCHFNLQHISIPNCNEAFRFQIVSVHIFTHGQAIINQALPQAQDCQIRCAFWISPSPKSETGRN